MGGLWGAGGLGLFLRMPSPYNQRLRFSRAKASLDSVSLPPVSSQRERPSNARLRCPVAILWRVASAIA